MNIEDVLEVITFSAGEMSFGESRASGASINVESPLSSKAMNSSSVSTTADSPLSSSSSVVKENDNLKEDQETHKVPQKKNLANNIQVNVATHISSSKSTKL